MTIGENDLKQIIQSLGGMDTIKQDALKQAQTTDRKTFKDLVSKSPMFAGIEVTDELVENFFKTIEGLK